MPEWVTTRAGKILLLGVACLLLQQVSAPYVFELNGYRENASLIHLHIGLLLAVAMLERDAWVFVGGYTIMLLGWLYRAIEIPYPAISILLGTVVSMLSGAWIFFCARWMHWPREGGEVVRRRDLVRFTQFGLLLLPAGLAFLGFFYGLVLTLNEALGSMVQVLFAKFFGSLIVTMPLVMAWTERKRDALAVIRHRAAMLVMLVLALALSVVLGAYSRWNTQVDGGLVWVLGDYRVAALALIGWCLLYLRPIYTMPMLSVLVLSMVSQLGATAAAANTALGFLNLSQLAVEVGILSLAMLYLYVVSRDRADLTRRLEEQALRDSMTNLPNIRALHQQDLSNQHELACLLLDQADSLSIGYGLRAQAKVMEEVAAFIAPQGANAFLLGGGQLALLRGSGHGVDWAHLLREVEHHSFIVDGIPVRLLPYLGVAPVSGRDTLEDALLQASNLALMARANNEVEPLREDISHASLQQERDRLRDASDILSCLRKPDGLVLYFQPIVPLRNRAASFGSINGEVLCRLRDDEGKIIPPAHFIGAVDAARRGPELDLAVIEALFAQLRHHPELVASCARVSVNLTGQSLASAGFHQRLIELLKVSPLPLSSLCFEITETMAIFGAEKARLFLEKLRAHGCKIAIDDFGVGMQSFARLKEMPVDIIKIDGSFIRNVTTDHRDRAMVQASISIARACRAQVVAEYVENAEIESSLQALGVQWGQGYLYAKPMPLLEGMRWMQSAAEGGTMESAG